MTRIYSHQDMSDISRSGYPRESFGPDSPNPYFAFELNGDDTAKEWLSDLACPVIGIGTGPLEAACDVVLPTDQKLSQLAKNIEKSPIASMVLVQHLRVSEILNLKDALTAESLAYSTVQNGPEFQKWRRHYKGSKTLKTPEKPLLTTIKNRNLSLKLNDPANHNAIGTHMRDALCETLDMALLDTSLKYIHITGNGRTFSVGGAIEEFGVVSDPATAHWVRSLRLPAWRLARLDQKLHVHMNGAAIGAGVEMAAFAKEITASSNAWFQLPELKYGLIPGAGGTASLARRIGRQRTAYMALSMEKITTEKALDWGLVDRIID